MWLDSERCVSFNFGDEVRPVPLKKVVVGYPFYQGQDEFRFERNLTYKLPYIIAQHSEKKPTLIFCNSRVSTEYTCDVLVKEVHLHLDQKTRVEAQAKVGAVVDPKLRNLLAKGVGFHHAGLEHGDRLIVEQLFVRGLLPVLGKKYTLYSFLNSLASCFYPIYSESTER